MTAVLPRSAYGPAVRRQPILWRNKRGLLHCSASSGTRSNSTGQVYKWKTPLVGWEWLEQSLGSEQLPAQLALHQGIVLHTHDGRVCVYDFLPTNPTQLSTIQTLLLGGSVAGHARVRTITAVPRFQCTLLGDTLLPHPHQAAERFQQSWDSQLRLFQNDCTLHTSQLAALLLARSEEQTHDA